jgi:beta-glucanase (GH16 family)
MRVLEGGMRVILCVALWLVGTIGVLGSSGPSALGQSATAAPAAGSATAGTVGTKLVWSDEFDRPGPPNPANWGFESGKGKWGNHEPETYCAWGSQDGPCDPKQPNAFVGDDGYLHIVGRKVADGVYTSARMKTEGLQGFQYGRIEARIKVPRGQGMWPAFWMLGDDIAAKRWPACGEIDIMENIGKKPDTIYGSIHGAGFIGDQIGSPYVLPDQAAYADGFHTFGITWSPQRMEFYVDDPTHPYETRTPADLPKGAVWPFEDGKYFIILNLAVGGDWPGNPDGTTQFPQEMLVDWVRVYQ